MAEKKPIIQAFGALPFKFDVRDYKLSYEEMTLPDEFELKAPKIKSQGAVGSCVAHSIAEANEWFHREQEKTDKLMSTGFIYGNRRNSASKSEGMYIREALNNMCKYGNVFKEDFKENKEVPEAIDLFEERFDSLKEKAYPNRFSTYFRLNSIEDIKYALYNYGPVVFGMTWRDGISVDKNGIMQVDEKAKKSGGHCMLIYGWNEKGWLIQNSWGSGWGKGGRAILPFDIKLSEVWGITDEVTSENPDIVKPAYNTTFKRFIAKLLNFFANLFRKGK